MCCFLPLDEKQSFLEFTRKNSNNKHPRPKNSGNSVLSLLSLQTPVFILPSLLPLLHPPHSPPVCYQILPIHSLFFRKNWFQLSCPAPVFPEIFKSGSPATRVLSGRTSTSDARRTKRKTCFVRIESMKADPISGCTAGWGWENAEGYRVEAGVWAIPGS